MPAPIEIVDCFESIVEIFLSGIKHKDRAAFILCDNLVEMACKTKAKHRNHRFDLHCSFHDAWTAQDVNLPANGIGVRIQRRRDSRNLMQHASPSITVDPKDCADAILDIVEVINRLWRNTSERSFRPWIKCAIRVIELYSSNGHHQLHQNFEDEMRNAIWRGSAEERRPKVNETMIEPGLAIHWAFIIKRNPELVEGILNRILPIGN